jgi:hypothetical protein
MRFSLLGAGAAALWDMRLLPTVGVASTMLSHVISILFQASRFEGTMLPLEARLLPLPLGREMFCTVGTEDGAAAAGLASFCSRSLENPMAPLDVMANPVALW